MKPKIRSVEKIWDYAEHNALTDLIYYNNYFYCVFRESDAHVFGQDGIVRVIRSRNGDHWEPHSTVEKNGVDLRDPKLSITPDNQLMLLVEEVVYEDEKALSRFSSVSFFKNEWSSLQTICRPFDWLWRITWHKGTAWGVSYRPGKDRWRLWLWKSENGLDWSSVMEWDIPDGPNETTLRFTDDDTMVALVRRNFKTNGHAWIGTSRPPYTVWKWKETKHHLGGPDFIILPDQQMWAAGRIVERNPYGWFQKTALLRMSLDKIEPALLLPSGGIDCSYPGMVYHDRCLWLSYYSSHEEKTAIYLAQIELPING